VPNPTPEYDADQQPEYRCASCQRLLFHSELSRYACFLCEDRAQKQITALPSLYRNLSGALAPGARGANNSPVTSSREAPLPVNLHVLDMLGPGGIVAELQAIEDSWRTARGRTAGPHSDGVRWFATSRIKSPGCAIDDHAVFIAYNLQWACESYEEVPFDLDVIWKLHAKAQTAITGERRRRITVVCLSEYDDGRQCGAELSIDVSAASTTCRGCGAKWGRDDWLRLGAAKRVLPLLGEAGASPPPPESACRTEHCRNRPRRT
jgi:hypothetical protein